MNKQFLAILGVLVVVLGGGALLVFEQGESAKPAAVAQLLLAWPMLRYRLRTGVAPRIGGPSGRVGIAPLQKVAAL